MTDDTFSRRLIRRLPLVGALLGALAGGGPASAQRVEAGQAPAAWIAYAGLVSDAVQARLASDDPLAVRLRAYMNQIPGADQAEGSALKIAFWIDASGKITRIDHAPFAQSQPNDDLAGLMVGLSLPKPSPKGMLLPLRLSIHLKPSQTEPEPTPT